jgi:hypothetical protein
LRWLDTGPVRVAAAVEDLVHRVAERQHDGAPVIEGVVERERVDSAAVLGLGRSEGRRNLFGEHAPLPELAGEVEEHLQLTGDVPEPGRRSQGDAVRPFEILQRCVRLAFQLGAVAAPVLLEGDQHLRRQLRDVRKRTSASSAAPSATARASACTLPVAL